VRSSCSQYWRRSLALTSALLPSETNVETARPSSPIVSRIAVPRVPDWDRKATPPGSGSTGAKVARIATRGAVLITPMQFGPMRRRPWRRASSITWRCVLGPVGAGLGEARRDDHRGPARPCRRSADHLEHLGAGTAMIARSTSIGDVEHRG
jgi:hypothetical protein